MRYDSRETKTVIRNKEDYRYYLEADRIALARSSSSPLIKRLGRALVAPDHIWRFERLLREVEYLKNCCAGPLGQAKYLLALRRLYACSLKLGFSIHPNSFGPGLSIGHAGPIIVNGAARVGANCRIHPGVTIGTQAGYSDRAPTLGDNIYIGPGAKIFGPIEIANDIAIGANSVVNRSFNESGITIAGVPARKVSDKGSKGLIILATSSIKAR